MNDTAGRAEPTSAEQGRAAALAQAAQSRLRVQPLLKLVPFVLRYRWQAIGALIALLVAAAATLAVPIAVRRMIDFGFTGESLDLVDSYFLAMLAVAAVLAGRERCAILSGHNARRAGRRRPPRSWFSVTC